MHDLGMSRFFRTSDPATATVLTPLPPTWWSRPYEYGWAQRFADADSTVLDAGCGVAHPFKFWLGTVCRRVVACDLDPRLIDLKALAHDLETDLGVEDGTAFLAGYGKGMEAIQHSLCDLPFDDGTFDRIFCLSVFEHLSRGEQESALHEFHRLIGPAGLIVLTLDYPTVRLAELQYLINNAGLEFAGPVDFTQPHEILKQNGLRCFRAVLRREAEEG